MIISRQGLFHIFLVFILFIVYGSLIPFRYNEVLSFSDALISFQSIPYLALGAGKRADLMANFVLYIPLSFFHFAWLSQNKYSNPFLNLLWVLVFGFVLIILLEFTQKFFAPRTVSLNDIIAESLGLITGAVIWFRYGVLLLKHVNSVLMGGIPAIKGSLFVYSLFYVLYALFPFDFAISINELQDKWLTNSFWFMGSCDAGIRCLISPLADFSLIIPIGFLLTILALMSGRSLKRINYFWGGILIGVFIEVLQFLLVSGACRIDSVIFRALGMMSGYHMAIHFSWRKVNQILSYRRLIALCLFPVVLSGIVVVASGGALFQFEAWSYIPAKFSSVRFIPLYHHYFSSETMAMVSLMVHVSMYGLLGFIFWLWTPHQTKYSASLFGWLAVLIALLINILKLLLVARQPDMTDLLIAYFSAKFSFVLFQWICSSSHTKKHIEQPEVLSVSTRQSDSRHETKSQKQETNSLLYQQITIAGSGQRLASLILFSLTIFVLWHYPLNRLVLSAALLVYAVILFRKPAATLFFVPALLPVLDFSDTSGWLLINEFDFFLAVTLAVLYWRFSIKQAIAPKMPKTFVFLWWLAAFSYMLSSWSGWAALVNFDINSLYNYFYETNALRVFKGFAWVLLLLPFMRLAWVAVPNANRYLTMGILAGLLGVSLFALYERVIFSELLNFTDRLRVSSTFPEMHIGGAPLEGFLVLALPFLLFPFYWKSLRWKFFAISLLPLSVYTLLVTFSRSTILAFFICSSILIIFIFYQLISKKHGKKLYAISTMIASVIILFSMVAPIVSGSFFQSRLANINSDKNERLSHWATSLSFAADNRKWLGNGLGSYPMVYFMESFNQDRPGTFTYIKNINNTYLQMNGGRLFYLNQKLNDFIPGNYILEFQARSDEPTKVSVFICEKSLYDSFGCVSDSFVIKYQSGGEWTSYSHQFNLEKLAKTIPSRPVKVSIAVSQGTMVQLDNISLTGKDKNQLIKNGDFSKSGDYWAIEANTHIPWHAENIWVHLLVEQGLPGVISVTLLIVISMFRLLKSAINNDVFSMVLFTSFVGFLTVGVIASLFDTPRVTTLFYLLIVVSWLHRPEKI